jgi:tRNA(Ile2)-agmatinylcytidine synthase
LSEKYDIIGYPSLIRLNPNIPWKTRGNGAISIQVGKKGKKKKKIGESSKKDIISHLEIEQDIKKLDFEKIKKIVKEIIQKDAKIDDKNTNPGFVLLRQQPKIEIYKNSVTRIVTLQEITNFLQ